MASVRPLPTLLGALILVTGVLSLSRSQVPTPEPPPTVTLERLPREPFRAVLLLQLGSEVRSREVVLLAAATPGARLGSSLRALRQWLTQEADGAGGTSPWPDQLGAPSVFWLGDGRAVLDFPLRAAPDVAVTTELRLLESVRLTARRQEVTELFVLVNGETPPTFLGQVALPQTLE